MNKIKGIVVVVLLGAVLAMILASCSKGTTTTLLIGRWSMKNIANVEDTTFIEEWEFIGDNSLIIHKTRQGPDDKVFASGNYVVKSYNKFSISSDDVKFPPQYIGTWQIVKRKGGTLRIVRNIGGLLSYEFRKI